MRTVYNGIDIADCRQQSLDVSPDYDPSAGIDFMRTKVRLVVQGVINPQSMAYTAGGLVAGTRAGLTLVNIRQALMTPRQLLQVYIGPDLVFVSPTWNPIQNQWNKADPGNGPLTDNIYVSEGNILGDRTIIVNFGVTFWVMGASNIVLSNRWICTHEIDRCGMTTRTLKGRAVVRADAISAGLIDSADDMRAALIVALPLNMRREKVIVTQEEDGTIVNYTVIDQETGNSLGTPGSPINVFYLDGNATAGFDFPLKTHGDFLDFGFGLGNQVGAGLRGGLDPTSIAMAIWGGAHTILTSALPRVRGRCMCRVEGGRNVPRTTLAHLAVAVCVDRSLGGLPTSLFITQGLNSDHGQWCEARMEWMPSLTQFAAIAEGPFGPIGALFPGRYMNLNNDYKLTVQGAPVSYPNAGRNPNNPLPNGSGTRGAYVQQMAFQALSTPGNARPAVPNVDGPGAAVTDRPIQ